MAVSLLLQGVMLPVATAAKWIYQELVFLTYNAQKAAMIKRQFDEI
jgi:hypothetical protein